MELRENKEYLEAGIRLLEYLKNNRKLNREVMIEKSGDYWRPLRSTLRDRDIFYLVDKDHETFQRPDLVPPMLAEYKYALNAMLERERELQDQRNDRRNSKIAQWVLIAITSLTLLLSAYQVFIAK